MKSFPKAFRRMTGMTVYDEQDAYDVCEELNAMLHLRFTPSDIGRILEHRSVYRVPSEREQLLLIEYQRWLEEVNAVDFSGMMIEVQEAIRDVCVESEVRQWAMNKWHHIIVDEAQDLDPVQFDVLNTVAGAHGAKRNLILVGDEDQSIYGWRGASFNLMERLAKSTGPPRRLGESFRCSKAVARVAQMLIQRNWDVPRPFTTQSVFEGSVEIRHSPDTMAEAVDVANLIRRWTSAGTQPENIAVLARTRYRLNDAAKAIAASGMPMTFVGERAGMYQTREGKQVLSMLRLAVNPRDALSFLRLRRSLHVGDEELNRFRRAAVETSESMFQQWVNIYKRAPVVEGATPWNATIHQVLLWANEVFNTATHHDVMRSLRTVAMIYRFKEPAELLHWIDRADFADNDTDVTGVHVGTIHSVKGMEFEKVIIIGLEEGCLPHKSAEFLNEERRLLFVAITRAMVSVVLSHSDVVFNGRNVGMKTKPSQFLYEIIQGLTNEKE
jgi:superfamily I DNA/RNA helicase